MVGGKRRSGKIGGRSQAVSGGVLSAGSATGRVGTTGRPRGGGGNKNDEDRRFQARGYACGYKYPVSDVSAGGDDPSRPIFLACASGANPVEAFVDPRPCTDPGASSPSYEYDPTIIAGGTGLGFRGGDEEELAAAAETFDSELIGGVGLGFLPAEEEEEQSEEKEKEVDELVGFDSFATPKAMKEKKGEGFLSIGGIRIYTEDTSSPEEEIEGFEEDDSDEEDGGQLLGHKISYSMEESSEDAEEDEEEDSLEEDDSLSLDEDSEIDDEMAEDYIEGIGGSNELLGSGFLGAWDLDSSDEDGLLKRGTSDNEGGRKQGGIDLMNASAEYGMKKPKSAKLKGSGKYAMNGFPAVDVGLSPLDDLLFMKDSRTALRRKKSSYSQISESWPRETMKAKYRNVPGGKKKQRKELIAVKRRMRMINRGVDLDEINSKIKKMVISEVDILSFQPMHSRDCSQVQRIASIYHLNSGCQGSGKKRFVTVTRSAKTCLPSSKDKLRLDKLLRAGLEDDDFVINQGTRSELRKQKKSSIMTGKSSGNYKKAEKRQSALTNLTRNGEGSARRKRVGEQSSTSYAERPVSFISSGVMRGDSSTEALVVDSNANTLNEKVTSSSSSTMGAFEMHTKGFGSKMMAKMGFVEGSGLGKDGQGIVQPIEAIKRPKSLGLGVQFTAEASSVKVEEGKIGAFEKHTKGFGSKMMAKMGFVPGTGLGKDGQGDCKPFDCS